MGRAWVEVVGSGVVVVEVVVLGWNSSLQPWIIKDEIKSQANYEQ